MFLDHFSRYLLVDVVDLVSIAASVGSKVLVVFNWKLQPRWPVDEQCSMYKIINIDF